MLNSKMIVKGTLLSIAMAFSQGAIADSMKLDDAMSSVSFFSVKNGSVGEAHSIPQLTGTISEKGELNIELFLTSVQTNIPIRDTRLNRHVFDSENHPIATITANVEGKIPDSGVAMVETEGELTLRGVKKKINVSAMVANTGDKVLVSSIKPIVINAADYGMVEGVKELQDLVKLMSIATSVPVNFSLTFSK